VTERVGVSITRIFDADRERVWREWTEPERFADWFGGVDCVIPLDEIAMDVRPAGPWRATMYCDGGTRTIHWKGAFREVVPPERLVFTITDQPGDDAYELVTVELVDLGDGRTEMRFEQRGTLPPEVYEAAATGWARFFDRIDERLRT
jgi:uncharacterized protein YndB with AHSA1/START domain